MIGIFLFNRMFAGDYISFHPYMVILFSVFTEDEYLFRKKSAFIAGIKGNGQGCFFTWLNRYITHHFAQASATGIYIPNGHRLFAGIAKIKCVRYLTILFTNSTKVKYPLLKHQ